jgi:hypothetical protein
MATSKKALELAAELADELRKRVSSYASITETSDASGNPLITLSDGSAATTEDTVVIRVSPRDWALAKDVLGSAQTVYTPSVIAVAVEGPTSGLGLARYVSVAHAWAIFATCAKRGTLLEYWESDNGTVASETTFATAANKKTSVEAELYWPLLSSQ